MARISQQVFARTGRTHSPDKSSMTGVLLRKALSILGFECQYKYQGNRFRKCLCPKGLNKFSWNMYIIYTQELFHV